MLDPVVLHQNRFNAPGLSADARGVALGKQGAALLPGIDALVGFLRILSDEVSLDDLLPGLSIREVRGALDSREHLVIYAASSSGMCDRAARVARLLGGLCFTGSGKHFVAYRDAAAPLGYDLRELAPEAASVDVVLYARTFTQGYRALRQIPLLELVLRLSPRPLPGGRREDEAALEPDEPLWLVTRPGVGERLIGYLHRHRVAAEATLAEPVGPTSAFAPRTANGRRVLIRVAALPRRMLPLLADLPGVEVHRVIDGAPHVAVELGYRHPLRLASCADLFDRRRFHFFSGRRAAVDVLAASHAPPELGTGSGEDLLGPPPLTSIERLVELDLDVTAEAPRDGANVASALRQQQLELRLVPSSGGLYTAGRRVSGVMLPWSEAGRLRRLVFLLPPVALGSCRAAPLDEGLLIVGDQGIELLPIGTPLWEAAPGILVPLGLELAPRLPAEVLVELCGGASARVLLLAPLANARGDARVGAIAIADSAFEPLTRRLLAPIDVEDRERSERLPPTAEAERATVANRPAGWFPLWSFRE